MKQIEDIVDRILDGTDQERNQSNIADTASETVVIDIDEIMDIFGAPMVYHEIVSKSKGLGSLSFIYTRLVHPVIAALFNSGVSEDQEETEKFFRWNTDASMMRDEYEREQRQEAQRKAAFPLRAGQLHSGGAEPLPHGELPCAGAR